MNQNYYDLYINSCIELAETLIVKSDYTALKINEYTRSLGGAYIEQDKTTWKYYLNMSGEYHPNDEQIYITSLDTLESVLFSKATLAQHRATAAAYQFGSRYFRELVTEHPDSYELIMGVLYPVDIHKAIAAPDMQVVGWAPHLVEEHEFSLIENINKWIENYNVRWNNPQFVHTHNRYMHTVMGILGTHLVPLIINLRLKACHTHEVHSYHVREYLASHGMLDVYLGQMTRKQALFFYRNIKYIHRNAGATDTFEWLTEKVLTDRGIPLSEYTMKHDTTAMPGELYADVTFRRRLLNPAAAAYDQQENFSTLDALLEKEQPLATGNREFSLFNRDEMHAMFKYSMSSTVKTKVLESAMVDYTDAMPITLHQVLLNYWLYMSQTGKYDTYVRVNNPRTGESISVHTRDSYKYFMYAWARSKGIELTTMVPAVAHRVHLEPTPTVEELRSVVDHKYVSEADAQFLLSLHPEMPTVTSVQAFREWGDLMHEFVLKQLRFVANQEHHYTRGLMENMMLRLYNVKVFEPEVTDQTYAEYFDGLGLPYLGFTDAEWDRIYRDLYGAVTSYSLDVTASASTLQEAMISLMRQLSSYSVQFITEINNEALRILNWSAIRLGDFTSYSEGLEQVLLTILKVRRISKEVFHQERVELPPLIQNMVIDMGTQDGGLVELPLQVTKIREQQITYRNPILLNRIVMDDRYFPEGARQNAWNESEMFASYNAMNEQERSEILSIYGSCFKPIYTPTHVDLEELMLSNKVPGFQYLAPKRNYLTALTYFYIPPSMYLFGGAETEVTLSGFWPNFGQEEVNAFNLNTGEVLATAFQYDSSQQEPVDLDAFELSGGVFFSYHFDPLVAGDEEFTLTREAFIGSWGHTTVSFDKYFHQTTLPGFAGAAGDVTLPDFSHSKDSRTLPAMTVRRDARTIGPFKGTAGDFTIEFLAAMGFTTLPALNVTLDSDTLPAFEAEVSHHTSEFEVAQDKRTLQLKSIYAHHTSRGVKTYVNRHDSLTDIEFNKDERTVNFKSAQAFRRLGQFKVVLVTRTLNMFNWMLDHSKVELTFLNVVDARTLYLDSDINHSSVNFIFSQTDDELTTLVATVDSHTLSPLTWEPPA